MRLPSPDDLLIALAERAARPLQRRGTPVPALRAPLLVVEPVGSLMVGAMFLAVAAGPETRLIGMGFVIMAVAEAIHATTLGRALSRDARGWGPELARRYRAEVLAAREGSWIGRMTTLVMAAGCLVLPAMAIRTADPLMVTGGAGFAMATLGRLAAEYAKCVFPEDPDLSHRVPAAAGA